MTTQTELDYNAKPPKDIHENSTRSLNEQRQSGRTEMFRKSIWQLLFDKKVALTDRQIMDALNESDVNNIRPEITRLKQDGLILELNVKVRCAKTGKSVRQTKINSTEYKPRIRA